MDHGLTALRCSSRIVATGADWSKIGRLPFATDLGEALREEDSKKWRKTVAPVAKNNWSKTGATGAAEGFCSSRRDPPKGGLSSTSGAAPRPVAELERGFGSDEIETGEGTRQPPTTSRPAVARAYKSGGGW